MGLFSFGAKEKPKAPPRREPKPDTMTSLALQNNLGAADLDYLLETYGPEIWNKIEVIHAYAKGTYELQKIILSRLDDISRRLDALEQSMEPAERAR